MLQLGKLQFDLSRPLVMGVVNVTPDSFSDGGRYASANAAIAHAIELIEEGANILDIGGESTRPGAQPVSVQEELDRVLPVIEGLQGVSVPISIDTSKHEVIREAVAIGVQMVNDVNALQDPTAMREVAASDAAICLMHKQGFPQTMQSHPYYLDVVSEVMNFLRERIAAVEVAGIQRNRIVVDPGFGFGKTLEHNLELLRELTRLSGLGVPVLAGLSRKSMLGTLTGREVGQRLPASLAAVMIAVQRGARIVRVHNVKETVDALKIWNAINDNGR